MSLSIDLVDTSAVVTGAGAGIGQAIAMRLAAAGSSVAVVDVDRSRAEQTARDIAVASGTAIPIAADAMDSEALGSAVETAASELGRLDICVNNVGGVSPRRFIEQSERSWRRHIDINLVSMLSTTAAAVPFMIDGGRGGSIVNVASIEGMRAAPMFAVYGACKAAMISFTQTMAVELSEHHIRVNCISPDQTRTPGNSGFRQGPVPDVLPERSPLRKRLLDAYVPLGREGRAEECGDVAAWLCSPLASYVTGTIIPVDGGTRAASGWVRDETGGWSLFGPNHPFY